jgi:hypothetical protein
MMKRLIEGYVSALAVVTREEIYRLLESDGRLNRALVDEKLAEMVGEDVLLQVLPEENEVGIEGFAAGPNLEVSPNPDILRRVMDAGVERRSPSILRVDMIGKRIGDILMGELEALNDNIAQLHMEPRRLELDYFALRVKYYSWRRFFYEKFDYVFFDGFRERLNECRGLLNRLQIE